MGDPPGSTPPIIDDPPQCYPWTWSGARSTLLLSSGIHELDTQGGSRCGDARVQGSMDPAETLDRALSREGAAPIHERTAVVAVGSNQSPAVIARKYAQADRTVEVATPFVRCTVSHLAVGHSAHVSRRGYIAAAPYRSVHARTDLVVSFFDEEQLAVVDATEPNYERVEIGAERFPLELVTGERPRRFSIYATRRGVIGGVRPIAFRNRQQDLFDLLARMTGSEEFTGDAERVGARLAEQPERMRERLLAQSLVSPDGLRGTVRRR